MALLVVGLLDPALILLALAFGSLIVLAARQGVVATLLGIVGVAGLVAFTSVLATVVGGIAPSPSRRRRSAATIVLALVISLVALAGPLLPSFIASLTHHTVPILSRLVRWLPSGWAPDAVLLASAGRLTAALPLVALLALVGGLAALWPTLLRRRLTAAPSSSSHRHRPQLIARLLPATPTGAVVSKELVLWARDPLRTTTLLIAVIVGLGSCVVPYLTHGTALLMPFAGVLTVLIAGAVACNLIGADGLTLRLTALTPYGARYDMLGRQLAWLLLVGPYVTVLTVLLTWWSDQTWAWPWALASLAALLGGAAGVVPLASVVKVQPLDESGGLTAGWPLKIYACLGVIALTATPAVGVLTLAAVLDIPWLSWLAVGVGVLSGLLCAVVLRRAASRRLRDHQVDILSTLSAASSPT